MAKEVERDTRTGDGPFYKAHMRMLHVLWVSSAAWAAYEGAALVAAALLSHSSAERAVAPVGSGRVQILGLVGTGLAEQWDGRAAPGRAAVPRPVLRDGKRRTGPVPAYLR